MGESVGKSDQPLISVIIPIYKVEPYLRKCVDSILMQTYTNLEVILVDDGSPDNCPAICDEYATKDSRVKVIHKSNGGLSDARNAGMDAASGDYLMFVDSDDWIEKNSVESLLIAAQKYNAQIAIGGTRRVEDGTLRVLKSDIIGNSSEIVMTGSQAMECFFENGCAAWGRLYRRETHNGIKFPVGEINEDEAIVLALLDRCHTVVQIGSVIYNYRCRPESITTSTFTEKKLAWYRHCVDNLEWIKAHHPELEPLAAKRLCGSVMWSLTEIAMANDFKQEWIDELLTFLHTNYKLLSSTTKSDLNSFLRLRILRYMPFGFYKRFIRTKRGIR